MSIRRIIMVVFGIVAIVSIPLFMILAGIIILHGMGATFLAQAADFIVWNIFGNILIVFSGVAGLASVLIVGTTWTVDQKWKDLRYKMAFFLYHSKVSNGDRLPLKYLARVAVCNIPEITKTLERMIERKELKGEVDRSEGVYIHRGISRKGMKILQALPPARVGNLGRLKKEALKGASWEDEDGETEELEPISIEELPPAHASTGKDVERIRCPKCDKMNRADHQFCTYCGEVL